MNFCNYALLENIFQLIDCKLINQLYLEISKSTNVLHGKLDKSVILRFSMS